MRSVVFILAFFAFPALAANVYKCKGGKGELIYQNLPCPNGAAPIATGHYDQAPDDPRQAVAAADEADRIRFERTQQPAAIDLTRSGADQRARDVDAWSAVRRDSRSVAGRQAIKEAANSQEAKDAIYRAEVKRWGKRVAGQPPMGYAAAPSPRDTFDAERLARDSAHKPPRIQTCNTMNGGDVTCFGCDGSIANGHVDDSGSGTLFGADGSIEQMHDMPKRDGSCVRDINDFCN